MIRIREIDHLVLRVVDLERMLRFYCDVLGCAIERRQDAIGLVQLRAGRSLIDLVPVTGKLGRAGGAAPAKEGRNLDHFCLRVEPFDEAGLRRHLESHGVEAGPLATRYGARGEGPSLYVSDPEGNVVELKGPPPASARTPASVLRDYFRAKDENRPHLLAGVFSPDARLEVRNRASTIAFPALTDGLEAIADVLVRSFGRTYENVYSFYMDRPSPGERTFSCDWLVAMSEKDARSVRVGCGRYDWTFDEAATGLATCLVITIEAMQVLPPGEFERVFDWIRRLDYPWTGAAQAVECAPPIEAIAPVVQYLGRRSGGGALR